METLSGTIIESVTNTFGVDGSVLKSRKRDAPTVLARQVAMYLIRQETDCTLVEVGRELGRCAATVTHGYQKIARRVHNDSLLREEVTRIQLMIHDKAWQMLRIYPGE